MYTICSQCVPDKESTINILDMKNDLVKGNPGMIMMGVIGEDGLIGAQGGMIPGDRYYVNEISICDTDEDPSTTSDAVKLTDTRVFESTMEAACVEYINQMSSQHGAFHLVDYEIAFGLPTGSGEPNYWAYKIFSEPNHKGILGTTGTHSLQGTIGDIGISGTKRSNRTSLNSNRSIQDTMGELGAAGKSGIIGTCGTQRAQGIQCTQSNPVVQESQTTTGTTGTQGSQRAQGNPVVQESQTTTGTTGTQGSQRAQGNPVVQESQVYTYTIGTSGTKDSNKTALNGSRGIQSSMGTISTQGSQRAQDDPVVQGSQTDTSPTGTSSKSSIVGTRGAQSVQDIQVYREMLVHNSLKVLLGL